MFEKIRVAFIAVFVCACFFLLGYLVHRFKWFPYSVVEATGKEMGTIFQKKWYYRQTNVSSSITVHKSGSVGNNPVLITEIAENDKLRVKIIENNGTILKAWDIDWFELWEGTSHIPKNKLPKSRPGTMIHGIAHLDNGSIVFNFENLGLICLDVDGNPIWRLPRLTHHSVYLEQEVLWVCSDTYRTEPDPRFPNYIPPFIEPMLLKVSLQGQLIEETSVLDILYDNNLHGFLFLPTITDLHTRLTGDIFHLNDVEPFPKHLEEGFFELGDVMISLRNVNAVLFYNDSTKKVKEITVGDFVRQHDPDFIDGYRISMFDNFNIGSKDQTNQSRILILSYPNGRSIEYYNGDHKNPFNSNIMGKHQWQENGNLLITDSMNGRVFEVNQNKEIVWEYINVLPGNIKGIVQEGQRLTYPI